MIFFASSENSLHMLVTSCDLSFINNTNVVGPRSESCGMPYFTEPHFASIQTIQTFDDIMMAGGGCGCLK